MKVAIPHWQGRVSPVFDVARNLLLVEVQNGGEVRREDTALPPTKPLARANQISQLGTNVLICGAISWPLEAALGSAGVQVIAQTCGPVEEVLAAFLKGQLMDRAFLMPGCRGRRGRFRARHGGGRARQGRPTG